MNKILTLAFLFTVIIILFGYFVFQRVNTPDFSIDRAFLSDNITTEGDGSDDLKVIPLILDNQTIDFPHTDDNTNESIIIRSDKDLYTSFAGADVYFSLTNTSDLEEDGILLFHFDQNFKKANDDPSGIEKPMVKSLEQRSDNNWSKQSLIYNNISINATKLAQALEKKKDIPTTFEVSAGTQFKLASHQTAYFKAKIAYPPGSEGEFWIETMGENGGYGLLDPWYASTYTHRKKITIDNAMVSGGADLTNFPVMISVNNDLSLKGVDFGGKVASGAGEFVFTSSDGTTKLDHEVEYYSSLEGKIVAWVEVPTLATASDTILYLYFGGPTTGATNQNKTGVWDADYSGVWHMKEITPGIINYDSTSNANHGTKTSTTAPNPTTGKIDGAQRFDGVDDEVNAGSATTLDNIFAAGGTISVWVNHQALTGPQHIFQKWISANGIELLKRDGGNTFRFQRNFSTNSGTWDTTAATTAGAQTYIVITYNDSSSTNDPTIYLNGASTAITEAAAPSGSAATDADGNLSIGNRNAVDQSIEGFIDEFRVSKVVRTAAVIATEYNNQNSPSTYILVDGAEKEIRTAPSIKIR